MSKKIIATVSIANPACQEHLEILSSHPLTPSQKSGDRLPKEVNSALFWLAKYPEVKKALEEQKITNLRRQWSKFTDLYRAGKIRFVYKSTAPAPDREEPTPDVDDLIRKLDTLTELRDRGILTAEQYENAVNSIA